MFLSFCICKIFIETAFFVVAIQLQLYNHHNKCCCLQDNSAILASGGATLGPKGALAPPKYLKKLVYIYSRVILIKKCYIHNIFIINLKWQVIIDCYVCAKKLFKLWIKIRTNNNLPLRIYCEIVVKILWR